MQSVRPETEPAPRDVRWRLVLISAGVGLHAFNEFAVVAALPRAAVDFDGAGFVGLVTALYAIGSVGGGLTGVMVRRRFGTRRAIAFGIAAFVAGALVAMLAPGMEVLAGGRLLSGFSEGLIVAIAYSLIPEVFPPALVPRVFALEAIVWALAGLLGPLAGGTVTDLFGWRMSFWVAMPLAAILALTARLALPAEPPDRTALGGLAPLRPVALGLIGTAAISAPVLLATPLAGWVAVTGGCALLVAAFRADARQERPVLPHRSFRPDAMGLGMWVMALTSVAHYFAQPFTALALQERFGLGATWVGLGSVVLALSWSAVAFVTSAPRFDSWRMKFVVAGPLALATGAAMTGAGIALTALPIVIAAQALTGAGFGLMWGAVAQAVMEAAPATERDRAGGIMPTIAAIGSAIGAGFGGTIADQTGLPATIARQGEAAILLQWGADAALALIATATGLALWYRIRPGADRPRPLTTPAPSAK